MCVYSSKIIFQKKIREIAAANEIDSHINFLVSHFVVIS